MAMVNVEGWLPVGSLVLLKDGDRPVMVTGQMQEEAGTGSYWDYLGYPYPEGRADASKDYFFNRDMVDGVVFVGYQDEAGLEYLDFLSEHDEEFRTEQAKRVGKAETLHEDTDDAAESKERA